MERVCDADCCLNCTSGNASDPKPTRSVRALSYRAIPRQLLLVLTDGGLFSFIRGLADRDIASAPPPLFPGLSTAAVPLLPLLPVKYSGPLSVGPGPPGIPVLKKQNSPRQRKNSRKFPFGKMLAFARSNTIGTQTSNIYLNQLQ